MNRSKNIIYNLLGEKFKFTREMKMVKITLDHKKCEGVDCAECVDVCPIEVLIIDGDNIVIRDTEECILCEVCMGVCPNGAVKVEED